MNQLTLLIKPASGACQMRCRYCFYADVMNNRADRVRPVMSGETLEHLVRRAYAAADCVNFMFQGGEPTLAGLAFFEELISLENRYGAHRETHNAIQTNGLLLDDTWCAFLKKNNFLVGLSVDGDGEGHDSCRVDASGEGTYERVMQSTKLLQKYGVDFNVLCVVSKANVNRPEALYRALRPFGYVQFIRCIDDFGQSGAWAPTAEEYGEFLVKTYDLYEKDALSGHYVSVRAFDNYIGILLGRPPESCGMSGQCTPVLTVESDGSVYPCDFYVLDEWCLGSINDKGIAALMNAEKLKDFISLSLSVPEDCRICPYFTVCRGGCRRDRENPDNGLLQKNRYCGSFRYFFEKRLNRMKALAEAVRQGRVR